MRRHRGHWVLIAGALLCLAPAGALVVSVAHPVERARTRVLVGLERGQLIVAWASAPMNPGFLRVVVGGSKDGALRPSWWRPRSTEAWGSNGGAPGTVRVAAVPLGRLTGLITGITGVAWWLRRRPALPGHCAACGYDLRGLSHQRCPECGRAERSRLARLLRRVGPRHWNPGNLEPC